jgi:hypothetical protein
VFYFNNIQIPLYPSAYFGSENSHDDRVQYGEWQYFELQPYKKVLLLGVVGTLAGLLYHKKYLYSGILVTSLLPLHKLATILFPKNKPNYLTENH